MTARMLPCCQPAAFQTSSDCAWQLIREPDAMPAVVGRPIVDNCMKGYNSSVLAYGMTGCGKTHTMLGALPRDGGMPEDARSLPLPLLLPSSAPWIMPLPWL